MHELISDFKALKKEQSFLIDLIVGIEFLNERYQMYRCFSFDKQSRINEKENIIIMKFVTHEPIRGRKFEVKLLSKTSRIFFSADCYDNPSVTFALELSKDDRDYELKGFDGRGEIILRFYFVEF